MRYIGKREEKKKAAARPLKRRRGAGGSRDSAYSAPKAPELAAEERVSEPVVRGPPSREDVAYARALASFSVPQKPTVCRGSVLPVLLLLVVFFFSGWFRFLVSADRVCRSR